MKFIRPTPNRLFNVSDSLGIKLLTRLRLSLSHLREHKLNHNFQNTINPFCSWSLESESTTHFFLRCQNFTDLLKCLMNELIKIYLCILTLHENFSRNCFYMEKVGIIVKQTNSIILSNSFILVSV